MRKNFTKEGLPIIVGETKWCSKCKKYLLFSNFKNSVWCIECRKKSAIKSKNKCRAKDPEDFRKRSSAASMKSNKKNKENFLRINIRSYRLKKFGLTEEMYQKMITDQDNKCAICGLPEASIDFRTKERKALSIDHNHTTNKVRELLCHYCNTALGLLRDNIENVEKAKQYLIKHDTNTEL